ncbi:MAG: Fe-S cluster assembly protein SufD [Candidatus Azotimanducaceae bacterium]|jgi:Fe-S cluster assembly protein SufD
MNTVAAIPHASTGLLETLTSGLPPLQVSPLARINALRAEAVNQLELLSLPTRRDEEWRFTDISPLTKLSLPPAISAPHLEAADIDHFYIEEATTRLVFVDGIYAPQLSSPDSNSGVMVSNLPKVIAPHAASIEAHLGRHAAFRDNVFTALNTAFLDDAAVIVVPKDLALRAPVHLLFIATQKQLVSTPRCLVVAEAGSEATVIEDYVVLNQPGWQEEPHLTNAATEIVLEDNARVNHIRIQREGKKAFHIANCAVSLGRSSNYQSVSVALGAQISRYNLDVRLAEGAECAVDGLALIAANQLADTHTCIDHTQPHGVSRQLHKCIAGGRAHAVFNGKVMVRRGAQHTDSIQSSRNLLLTSKAHVDTKPQLEIFADDVKCEHGATIGELDSEGVFYLKSRGLADGIARGLLTYAFAAEIIDRIPVSSLKHQLEKIAFEQTRSQA